MPARGGSLVSGDSARRLSIPELLKALRITATRKGNKWIAPCPNPAHADRSPSWSIIDDVGGSRHGSHYCFSCPMSGGPWELVAAVEDIPVTAAGKWIREHVGVVDLDRDVPGVRIEARPRGETMRLPWGVVIPSVDEVPWFEPALAYVLGRGLTRAQIVRWRIGFATTGLCSMRVVVPVVTNKRLVSYVARAFVNDGRARYDTPERSEPGVNPGGALFGEPAFEPLDAEGRRSVGVVTEGVFKTLAMERAGAPNPMGTLGSKSLGPEKIAIMCTFRRLLVATDPDSAGDKAFEEIADSCARYSDVRRVPLMHSPDDASEEENRAAWMMAARRRKCG